MHLSERNPVAVSTPEWSLGKIWGAKERSREGKAVAAVTFPKARLGINTMY